MRIIHSSGNKYSQKNQIKTNAQNFSMNKKPLLLIDLSILEHGLLSWIQHWICRAGYLDREKIFCIASNPVVVQDPTLEMDHDDAASKATKRFQQNREERLPAHTLFFPTTQLWPQQIPISKNHQPIFRTARFLSSNRKRKKFGITLRGSSWGGMTSPLR